MPLHTAKQAKSQHIHMNQLQNILQVLCQSQVHHKYNLSVTLDQEC